MIALPDAIAPRAYAGLSPMAKVVLLLESIPDDPNDPEYAKWQVVDTPVPAAPPAGRTSQPRSRVVKATRPTQRSRRAVGVTTAGHA